MQQALVVFAYEKKTPVSSELDAEKRKLLKYFPPTSFWCQEKKHTGFKYHCLKKNVSLQIEK